MSNNIQKKLLGFLEDKQLWVWLLVYIGITGVLFGLLFGIYSLFNYLLSIIPWIVIMALFIGGLAWGLIKYSLHHKNESPAVKRTEGMDKE